jgi:hypothetical protein
MIQRAILALVIIAALVGGGFWYWTTTPQYAVREASAAVKAHDVARFHEWVDVHEVASSAVQDILAEPMQGIGSVGLLERIVGLGVLTIFRPNVVGTVEKQIDVSVAKQGMDPDVPAQSEQPQTLLGELKQLIKPPSLTETLRDYGFTKQNYRGLGDVKVNGELADVPIRFFIPKNNGEVQVHLALAKGSSHWRIIRISNLQEIVRDIIGNNFR